jgi:Mobilization protein NikA
MSSTAPNGGKKKGGSEKRRRAKIIRIRVDEKEAAAVRELADKRGLSTGALLRQTLLNIPPGPAVRRPSADAKALGLVLGALGKIGSNLNQLVHYANMGRTLEGSLEETLRDLREMRLVVMQALGYERNRKPPE